MRRVASTHLAMRLQPADARSRGCQHLPAARLTRCFTRLGPPASSRGWTPLVLRPIQRRFLPAPPPSSACRAGGHPAFRTPAQRAVVQPRCWTHRQHAGWPPALALRQRRTSRPAGCGPVTLVRLGPHQPLGPGLRGCRLPRPCGVHAGARRTFGSAPAPAGTDRCPLAAACQSNSTWQSARAYELPSSRTRTPSTKLPSATPSASAPSDTCRRQPSRSPRYESAWKRRPVGSMRTQPSTRAPPSFITGGLT